MNRKGTKTTCSRIADHYYNTQTRYIEGCGNHLVIIEIEKLCEQGRLKVSRDNLIPIQAQINCKRSKKVLEMLQKTVYYES